MSQEEVILKQLGPNRELLTPMEVFRASDFRVGTIESGAHLSGRGLTLYQVSSPVKVKLLNVELFNAEAGWIEVEFRDGGFQGGRVLGPYRLNLYSNLRLPYEDVLGRTFTSSIYAMIRSGYTANPINSGFGVLVNASICLEPRDYYE